jgi:hypothetical protein
VETVRCVEPSPRDYIVLPVRLLNADKGAVNLVSLPPQPGRLTKLTAPTQVRIDSRLQHHAGKDWLSPWRILSCVACAMD